MYESQVTFVMDTICPWLDHALDQVRSSSSSDISFTLHFSPYQPSPNREATIPDRTAHALHHQHNDNAAAQQLFQAHMLSLAEPLNIPLGFTGPTGNSFPGHRVIQQVQEAYGTDIANKLVDAVFRLYFAEGRHPGEDEMLIKACVEAGVDEKEAKKVADYVKAFGTITKESI
ncbi:hypothetical protein Neosp_004781 [[Neocosmospora] mangrovei]